MPVYRTDQNRAKEDWVEIDRAEMLTLDRRVDGGIRLITPSHPHEVVIVVSGEVLAQSEHGRVTLRRSDWLAVPPGGVTLQAVIPYTHGPAAEVMRISGHWDSISDLNVFQVRHDFEVETHYHDFHEYWLIFRGSGPGFTEGVRHDLSPGDMVATARGNEHGMPVSSVVIEAVAVETEPMGQRRMGHLHRAEHGEPVPFDGDKGASTAEGQAAREQWQPQRP